MARWKSEHSPASPRDGYLELERAPGTAQVDFGNFRRVLAGRPRDMELPVVTLPHSNARRCAATFSERPECLHDGLRGIFERIGRAPSLLVPGNVTEAGRMVRGEVTESRLLSQLCFVKQIFRKSSSNSFGSQHERSSDFTKGCGTYPSFLFPSMSESVTRRLSPLNSTSLPWWTILSTSADASLSSANTVPHFPNSMLVVSTIDWRS